jgi:nuclear pore complex protein Nup133
VWSYTTQQSDPVVLTFPVRSEVPSLASLVSPSAGSHEPGLILVKPKSGQMAYWDAVGSAIADGLIQRSGVQSILPLLAGETATYLCNAEPAGFVIATSSGKLWNVSVRDSEGRPHLSFVGMSSTGGGWGLGGLRLLIAGIQRGEIVAVKAGWREGNIERRDVFVATKQGGIQKWELARGGVYRLSGQADLSGPLQDALKDVPTGSLSVVDIASVPHSDRIVILASYIAPNSPGHAIFLCTFPEGQTPKIISGSLLPLSPPEHSTLRPATFSQPQIYVPSPGKTAFIAYSRGFSIITLPSISGDWEYCDTVTFRDDYAHLRIIGSGQEDLSTDRASNRKLRNPGVILVVQGAGVIRCETFDMELGEQRVATSGTEWIQSKIEQAVFYGVSPENPLDFKPRQEWQWKTQDVERVATQISNEILTSSISLVGRLIQRQSTPNSDYSWRNFYCRDVFRYLR